MTELESVSGRRVRAIEVFAHALRFFREHALKVKYKTSVSFHHFHTKTWHCHIPHIPDVYCIVSHNYHSFNTYTKIVGTNAYKKNIKEMLELK